MKSWLLGALLPLVVGPITKIVVDYLKKAVALLDTAPTWSKQFIAAIIAAGLTWAGAQVGQNFCGDDSCTVQNLNLEAVAAWLVATVLHNSKKLAEKK